MSKDGCVSSRLVPVCDGEDACGFFGLPHVLCVPVPPYARRPGSEPITLEEEPAGTTLGAVPPQDRLRRG